MATYNGERFLRSQLASIAAQHTVPLELIVCDDQSTDATEEIVAEFATTVSFRVRFVLNEERLYFGANFLKAASLCTGDYIAFCDQDDVWEPTKLTIALTALAEPRVVLFAHDAVMIDQSDAVVGHHRHDAPTGVFDGYKLDPWVVFFGFTCVFDRRLLAIVPPEERPFDVIEPTRRMSHDRWICFLASITGSIAYSDEPLARYRQHADAASTWMRERRDIATMIEGVRTKFAFYLEKRLTIVTALRRLADRFAGTPLCVADGTLTDREAVRAAWRLQEDGFRHRLAIALHDRRTSRVRAWIAAWRRDAYRDPLTGERHSREMLLDLIAVVLAKRGQAAIARSMLGVDEAKKPLADCNSDATATP